jgi:hypothetical protein
MPEANFLTDTEPLGEGSSQTRQSRQPSAAYGNSTVSVALCAPSLSNLNAKDSTPEEGPSGKRGLWPASSTGWRPRANQGLARPGRNGHAPLVAPIEGGYGAGNQGRRPAPGTRWEWVPGTGQPTTWRSGRTAAGSKAHHTTATLCAPAEGAKPLNDNLQFVLLALAALLLGVGARSCSWRRP